MAGDVTLAHDDVTLAAGDVTILHAKRVPMGVKNLGVFYRSFGFVLDDSRPAQPRSSDKNTQIFHGASDFSLFYHFRLR